MLVENLSGRNISMLWITHKGHLHHYISLLHSETWYKDNSIEDHSWVAVDNNGYVVPLNGQCVFTKSAGHENITASFHKNSC